MIQDSLIDRLKQAMRPREFYAQFFDLSRCRNVRNMVPCPFHVEKKPSCQIDLETGDFRCFGCGKFGDMIDFYREIKEIASVSDTIRLLADEYGIEGAPKGLGGFGKMPEDWPASKASTAEKETPKGCNVERYAEQKAIPAEFLHELGLSTVEWGGSEAMVIPYKDKDGEEVAVRYRIGLGAESNFRWKKGSVLYPYGLWRLNEAREAGYAVLVEGESDTHTLWYNQIPAIGIPGVNTWRDEWTEHFEGLDKIYVIIERDSGGDRLIDLLEKSGIVTRVMVLELGAAKDPSDFYLTDPQTFSTAWREAMDSAKPWSEWLAEKKSAEALSELENEFAGEASGLRRTLPLPWPRLSDMSRALRPGTVTVIVGPPNTGKSIFTLEIALGVHQERETWSYLPLEDRRTDLLRRLLAVQVGSWSILNDDAENAQDRSASLEQHRAALGEFSLHVTENPRRPVVGEDGKPRVEKLPYQKVLAWIEGELQKSRVVFVDPISQIDFNPTRSWSDERDFILRILGMVAHAGASVVLVAHTVKRPGRAGSVGLSVEDVQGSAAFGRNCHTVIMVDAHEPKDSLVYKPMSGEGVVTHERTVLIARTRFGRGSRNRIAYHLDVSRPRFEELGVIHPKQKKKKSDEN